MVLYSGDIVLSVFMEPLSSTCVIVADFLVTVTIVLCPSRKAESLAVVQIWWSSLADAFSREFFTHMLRFGNAITASIPNTTIVTMSSTSEKPLSFFINAPFDLRNSIGSACDIKFSPIRDCDVERMFRYS